MNPAPASSSIVALLGHQAGYSLSSTMHNAAFATLGLPHFYVTISVEPGDLPRMVEAMRRLDFLGANVTWPHKESVITLLDRLSPEADECGSVNTVVRDGTGLVGHSTDGEGFLLACGWHGVVVEGASLLVLGSGGVGRAVAFAAAAAGASRIVAWNRNAARALALAGDLSSRRPGVDAGVCDSAALRREAKASDLVVNATPLGMRPGDALPLPAKWLGANQVVFDLVYAPRVTPLMEAARRAGASAFGGLAMLLFQGAAAFRLWTGKDAPLEAMAAALGQRAGGFPASAAGRQFPS